jgi:phosphatidylinositol alpha-1,6-mannosyltransferase
LFGIPCFLWLYGGETGNNYAGSPFRKRLAAFLLRRCHRLVTNSPTTTREFLDAGIARERIIEIVPAVDSDMFSPGPRPEPLAGRYGLTGKRIVMTVGRLVERKGQDMVLRAMRMLGNITDLHYCIVGDGPDRGRLERLTEELGIGSRVTFAGKADPGDLPDFYRLCDIFVMPNRTIVGLPDSIEGFGMTFIEAGACGRPVIGGRSGGAVDAVADGVTGYLIDPENPRDLAEKIVYLLDNPEVCSEMGRVARERVVDGFTWRSRAKLLADHLTIRPDLVDGMPAASHA